MAQANRNNSNLSAPSVNANKFKVQVGVVSHLLIAVVFILSMMGTATAEEVRLKEVLSWPYQMGGGAAQPNDHASCGVSADFTLKLFASYHITDATFEKGETNVNFTPQQATHVTGQCYKDKNMTKLKITWHKGKEYILEMDIYSTEKDWRVEKMWFTLDLGDEQVFPNADLKANAVQRCNSKSGGRSMLESAVHTAYSCRAAGYYFTCPVVYLLLRFENVRLFPVEDGGESEDGSVPALIPVHHCQLDSLPPRLYSTSPTHAALSVCVAAVCAVGVLVGLVAWIVCGRMKRHLLLTTTGGYEDFPQQDT
ncbi:uncharacterized protein LOC134843635 isoform X2 [Symsagittifera roscoffensis]|uniref:uncharacterized protein LOC134843635 isoform X2 n=1 Tax=Symsagittifera roscoffensis TaxID=84072 RepID=UPI00307B343F